MYMHTSEYVYVCVTAYMADLVLYIHAGPDVTLRYMAWQHIPYTRELAHTHTDAQRDEWWWW